MRGVGGVVGYYSRLYTIGYHECGLTIITEIQSRDDSGPIVADLLEGKPIPAVEPLLQGPAAKACYQDRMDKAANSPIMTQGQRLMPLRR